MIKLTDINGQSHYLTPDNIARITEAGASSQWHGIRAIIKTHDGSTLEVQETADQIVAQMSEVDVLKADIAGHEAANGKAVPESVWESLDRLIKNGAQTSLALTGDAMVVSHYREHLLAAPVHSQEQRYQITSIKYLAGELTLVTVDDAEVPQSLDAGQVVTLK